MKFASIVAAIGIAAVAAPQAHSQQVEVMHWWTSPGEAAAISLMKQQLEAKGIGWVDAPIAGGGGDAAMTALRARVVGGDAPTAAVVVGYDVRDWAALDLLGDISEVAAANNWESNYPAALKEFGTFDGK